MTAPLFCSLTIFTMRIIFSAILSRNFLPFSEQPAPRQNAIAPFILTVINLALFLRDAKHMQGYTLLDCINS